MNNFGFDVKIDLEDLISSNVDRESALQFNS